MISMLFVTIAEMAAPANVLRLPKALVMLDVPSLAITDEICSAVLFV